MRFTPLTPKQETQSMIEEFGGYNHTPRPSEAEFYDMKNMTSDSYPLLGTRAARGTLDLSDTFDTVVYKDGKLLGVEEGKESQKFTVKETVEAADAPQEPKPPETIKIDKTVIVKKTDDITIDSIGSYIYIRTINDEGFVHAVARNVVRKTENEDTIEIQMSDLYDIEIFRFSCIGFDDYKPITYSDVFVESIDKTKITLRLRRKYSGDDLSNISNQIQNSNLCVNINGVTFVLTEGVEKKFTQEWALCRASSVWSELAESGGYNVYVSIITDDFLKAVQCEWTSERIKEYYARELTSSISCHGYIYVGETVSLNSVHYSKAEYEAQCIENDKEYAEAYEQYRKDMFASVNVVPRIAQDIAKAMEGTTVRIGETELYCKNAEGDTMYLQKPIPRIEEGTEIETNIRPLTITTYELKTGEKKVQAIGAASDTKEKKIISMGADVVLLPDNLYMNMIQTEKNGTLESESSLKSYGIGDAVKKSLSTLICTCVRNGDKFLFPEIEYSGYLPETAPTTNAYCMNSWTDPENPKLQQYSVATKLWTTVETYLKIYSIDLDESLKEGDSVRIFRGQKDEPGTQSYYAYLYFGDELFIGNEGKSHLIYASGKEKVPQSLQQTYGKMERNYIVIKGLVSFGSPNGVYDPSITNGKEVFRIKRTVPKMDYVVECNNRLWGCRYGKNEDGEFVNEIYASKLGDPKNWFCYEGTAMDSYSVSLGSDGPFTGAVVYAGTPIFFKENYMHRIYGNYPANYQVMTQTVRGVQTGSDRSLSVVNEVLFYHSNDGICVYDGSMPYCISDALGGVSYKNAIGAGTQGKYFVSLEREDGKRELMVYDLAKRMWHKEDNLPIKQLIGAGETLVAVTQSHDILDMLGKYGTTDECFEWYAESGNIGYSMAGKKYVGRILMRFTMERGSFVRVGIAYDDEREFRTVTTYADEGTGTASIPIRPMRCDHFRIRIEGKGQVKLISVSKTIKKGASR